MHLIFSKAMKILDSITLNKTIKLLKNLNNSNVKILSLCQ